MDAAGPWNTLSLSPPSDPHSTPPPRSYQPRQNHLQGARDRLQRYVQERQAAGEEVGEEEATFKEVRESVGLCQCVVVIVVVVVGGGAVCCDCDGERKERRRRPCSRRRVL